LAAALLVAATPASAQAPSPDPEPDAWFGLDKVLHFSAGAGLGASGYAAGTLGFDSRWAGVAFGGALGLVVGAAKEGLDAAGLGTPSYKDFIWTAVGTVLGIGVSVTFDAALRGPVE
jgi:putative lipoprotein